jgi:hypothetical protein
LIASAFETGIASILRSVTITAQESSLRAAATWERMVQSELDDINSLYDRVREASLQTSSLIVANRHDSDAIKGDGSCEICVPSITLLYDG